MPIKTLGSGLKVRGRQETGLFFILALYVQYCSSTEHSMQKKCTKPVYLLLKIKEQFLLIDSIIDRITSSDSTD